MRISRASVRWKEALPRILLDFAVVQGAALASMVVVTYRRLYVAPWVNGAEVARVLGQYYLDVFLPLSAIFPVVFVLSGFYTRSRHYAVKYKWRAILRGSALATMIYLFANFLLTRADVLPRSATVFFALLVSAGTIGSRLIKAWLLRTERPAAPAVAAGQARSGLVLVVGGAGYIGSLLCRKLLAEGKRVRVLDSLIYGEAPLGDLLEHPNFELLRGDCRNIQGVVSSVGGADAVVHLAAIVGDPACEQDQRTALEINYAATRMLVEIAKGNGTRRFLFASSCSVYGATESLMDERSAVEPISLYAQTKLDSEAAILAARTSSFHPTVLRLGTVFGHSYRPRFDLVVNLLCGRAHREGIIPVYNGGQWRPFLHVRDVAAAFVQALNAPVEAVSGEILNTGDSRMNHTLLEVALAVQAAFPHARVEQTNTEDRRNYRVSFGKIRERMGFECKVSLAEGVGELKLALEGRAIPDYTDLRYHNQRFLKASGSPVSSDELDSDIMAVIARHAPQRAWGVRPELSVVRR